MIWVPSMTLQTGSRWLVSHYKTSGTVREYKILSETFREGKLRTQWAGALASVTQGERCASFRRLRAPLIWKRAWNLKGAILIGFVLRYNEATVQVYKAEQGGGLEGGL